MDRRTFLKHTGLAAASLALQGCTNSFISRSNAARKPNIFS